MSYGEAKVILSSMLDKIRSGKDLDYSDEEARDDALRELSLLDMDGAVKRYRQKERRAIVESWKGSGLDHRVCEISQKYIDTDQSQNEWDIELVVDVLQQSELKTRQDVLYQGCTRRIRKIRKELNKKP